MNDTGTVHALPSGVDLAREQPLPPPEGSRHEPDEALLRRELRRIQLFRRLPGRLEDDFMRHIRQRVVQLLRRSLYGILAIYAVVSVLAALYVPSTQTRTWLLVAVLPVGLVLVTLWVGTRLRRFEDMVDPFLHAGVVVTTTGCALAALGLGQDPLAQIAAYETIYVLIVVFCLLRMPLLNIAVGTLSGFALALLLAWLWGARIDALAALLFFGVPWGLCAVVCGMFEHGERRDFLQTALLSLEAERLRRLHEQAQAALQRQRRQSELLALAVDQPDEATLMGRLVQYLARETDAAVVQGWQVRRGQATLLADWGGEGGAGTRTLALEDCLFGPCLARGEPQQVNPLPPDYLSVRTASVAAPVTHLLLWPLRQGQRPVALLELGRLEPFTDATLALLEELALPAAQCLLVARSQSE